jgi:hypothetical protein
VSSNFLRSLAIAALFSSIAPTIPISGILVGTWLLSHIPGLEPIPQLATNMLLAFLDTFGSGSPWQGMLTISLACGFVGALFDTYNFYSFQSSRGN